MHSVCWCKGLWMRRFAFPVLKPPEPFRCASLQTLEQGLGTELAASTADACSEWLGGSRPSSRPDQAPHAADPVWLVHIADAGVLCHPLSEWQVSHALSHTPAVRQTCVIVLLTGN